ncbi:hypothetical protein ABL78_5965 [Leptomonas seymouri]|uniref:Uncharacterized protein n=1 Tax=Leptomonas seymouri TaxID=5684 RepID=A0A0N1HW40_LEPSE|nr:hypothetical protein ABL78_5965 [Leptomonas seymouri]|eukprot:KPI84974.1 hypothetical protein ABL78_5965 [Leptomonas seymouri]
MHKQPDFQSHVRAPTPLRISPSSTDLMHASQPAAEPPQREALASTPADSADSFHCSTRAASSTASQFWLSSSLNEVGIACTAPARDVCRSRAAASRPAVGNASGESEEGRARAQDHARFMRLGEDCARGGADADGVPATAPVVVKDGGAGLAGSFDGARGRGAPALPSVTRPFWFNGQLMRVELVRHRDDGGREEARVVATEAVADVSVGVQRFCVPCRFAGAKGERQDAGGCPSALLPRVDAATSEPVASRAGEDVVASSGSPDETSDQRWLSTVESAMAAQMCAAAHRQLFRWADAANSDKGSLPDVPQLRSAENEEEAREALLRWWSLHH